MKQEFVTHTFPAIYQKNASILILGSFPSVQSRKHSFYYMHPQNRFWKLLSDIFLEDVTTYSIEEKIAFLHRNCIALYDVIESCTIKGSSDCSISDVTPAHIHQILKNTSITHIYLNGNKAYSLFIKHFPELKDMAHPLPSSSPANARYSYEKLLQEWKNIIKNENA